MKIYIAAPFMKQEFIRGVCSDFEQAGIFVTSRWPWETEPAGGYTDKIHSNNAAIDLADIDMADAFVLDATQPSGTGGKHVETGYAIAKDKRIVIVGGRENVFHYLPQISHVDTWEQAINELLGWAS